METASLGVILDSSVVIEAERRHLNVAQFLKQIIQKLGETEVALCSISVAELVHGIYGLVALARQKKDSGNDAEAELCESRLKELAALRSVIFS